MNLRHLLTRPSQPFHPVYVYVVLVLLLLVSSIQVLFRLSSPSPHAYDLEGSRMVGSLLLLFNLLAFQFRWPAPVTAALRLLVLGWLVYTAFYTWQVFMSHVPSPAHGPSYGS